MLPSLALLAAALAPGIPAGAAGDRAGGAAMQPVVRYLPLPSGQAGFVGALPEIYVEGAIGESTLTQLRRIVDEHGLAAARVRFDSRGGDLLAAIEIGYYLREKAFVTEVAAFGGAWGRFRPGQCLSACAVAYLGGRYRYLDPGSRFAVHRFSTPGAENGASAHEIEQQTQALAGVLVAYLGQMGVDVEFFRRMSERAHADMDYLGRGELLRMGVVNDGSLPPSWTLEIDGGEAVMAGRQERIANSATVTLRCGGPVDLHVATQHFEPGWQESLAAADLQWALGDERVPVDPRAFRRSVSVRDGYFRAAIGLDAAHAARLSSAPAIGLAVTAGGRRYDYRVDIVAATDREAIRRFVDFCSGSGRVGLAPAGSR